MKKNYRLSYQINSVTWDGTVIKRSDEKTFLSMLDIFQSCGVNEVMLSGYTDVEKSAFNMAEESERVGNILRSRGMKAAQHHGLAPLYAPLSDSQDSVRSALRRSVEYTAKLNADVLVIHPGRMDAHFDTMEEYIAAYQSEVTKHGVDALFAVCVENLHEAGEYASSLGIKIALENVDRFEPMGGMAWLPKLIEAADSSAVGFCLDSGHAHCCGVPVTSWIERMGGKLFTTHFHDNRGARRNALTDAEFITPCGIDEHTPPGFGTIPWFDVIQALWKSGYDRTVNFESTGWPNMDLADGYKAAIQYWRTCEFLAEKDLLKAK